MRHQDFMLRCLELSERGQSSVGVNPLVGSVLVRKGEVVAEGWHARFGGDHAERMLINKFDQEILPEDILYVNLEPCCHEGKTPPCTDMMIQSGIKHVVYGMRDPNPQVAGRGMALLRAAGIDVAGPVLPELCRRRNRGFLSLQEQGRPFITLKRAQTKAGATTHADGSPLKITSGEQDEWSHRFLRARSDAILVGVQTVISDDPLLTVRFSNKEIDQVFSQPLGLILDPHLRIPLEAKVVNGDRAAKTILVVDQKTTSDHERELLQRGVRILRIPMDGSHFDWRILWSMLTTPDENFSGITSILVEGGARTWRSFKEAGQYDEEVTLVGDE